MGRGERKPAWQGSRCSFKSTEILSEAQPSSGFTGRKGVWEPAGWRQWLELAPRAQIYLVSACHPPALPAPWHLYPVGVERVWGNSVPAGGSPSPEAPSVWETRGGLPDLLAQRQGWGPTWPLAAKELMGPCWGGGAPEGARNLLQIAGNNGAIVGGAEGGPLDHLPQVLPAAEPAPNPLPGACPPQALALAAPGAQPTWPPGCPDPTGSGGPGDQARGGVRQDVMIRLQGRRERPSVSSVSPGTLHEKAGVTLGLAQG